jgi:hypothetical protein
MKRSIYNPGTIKLIQIVTLLLGLQINSLFAANPNESNPLTHFKNCVSCNTNVLAIQKEELLDELILLAPTTPTEAAFSDETENPELNPAPIALGSASFDDDPEPISPCILECLAPTTPAEADFND